MATPRGIRNNNPGNIERGEPWQGLATPEEMTPEQRAETRFAVFKSPEWGIRAIAKLLQTYFDKHNLRSVAAMINRWAPPVENNTDAYAKAVAAELGVSPYLLLDKLDHDTLRVLVRAIIKHENGQQPYSDATLDAGVRLALGTTEQAAPIERKDTMALPAAAQFALAIAPELLKLLPWYSSGSKAAERNIKAVEAVAPVLIEAAKAASGVSGAVEAVETVQSDPAARAEFVKMMATKWEDVQPEFEFEEKSRSEARGFAAKMTEGDGWRAIGFGVLLGTLSLVILVGGGWVLYSVLMDATTPPEQKGMILGAIVASVTTVIAYFFGSSAGSKRAGDAVRAIAERR